MPLGNIASTFWDEGKKRQIGNANLFRLEEYNWPEFKVSVQTPEEDGQEEDFSRGRKSRGEYPGGLYFGGPVANAECRGPRLSKSLLTIPGIGS